MNIKFHADLCRAFFWGKKRRNETTSELPGRPSLQMSLVLARAWVNQKSQKKKLPKKLWMSSIQAFKLCFLLKIHSEKIFVFGFACSQYGVSEFLILASKPLAQSSSYFDICFTGEIMSSDYNIETQRTNRAITSLLLSRALSTISGAPLVKDHLWVTHSSCCSLPPCSAPWPKQPLGCR